MRIVLRYQACETLGPYCCGLPSLSRPNDLPHLILIASSPLGYRFCPILYFLGGKKPLVTTAMTTLSSKIINVHKKKMAKIAVDAVMAVANLERNDVNFDMIKVI